MENNLIIEAEKILMRHDVSVVIEASELLHHAYDNYFIPVFELWHCNLINEEEYRILRKYFDDKKENNKNGK